MDSDEMFNWPDGDVILRATHGTDSRDFRVHKLFLSFSSPVFKDMFKLPQPSSAASDVDIVDMVDPPRALEVILRFIYPSADSPTIDDLTLLSEVLVLADKYDIRVARPRLRSSLVDFARTEPLRVYAIACRLGLEDEMKIASSHTTSIHLPELAELPDEFRFIPATEYHRLILLHATYRKKVEAITRSVMRAIVPKKQGFAGLGEAIESGRARVNIEGAVREGIPLNYESFKVASGVDPEVSDLGTTFRSIFDQANSLKLTV